MLNGALILRETRGITFSSMNHVCVCVIILQENYPVFTVGVCKGVRKDRESTQ